MNGDLSFIIGVAVGFVVSLIGYLINHLLSLREKSVIREFEMRKEGKEFFKRLYGCVAHLSDLVASYYRVINSDKAIMFTEKGYRMATKPEIAKEFKEAYESHVKLWYESRKKGDEIFLTLELARSMESFWGNALFLSESDVWKKESLNTFGMVSDKIMSTIEELLGLKRKKWLRMPKSLRRTK